MPRGGQGGVTGQVQAQRGRRMRIERVEGGAWKAGRIFCIARPKERVQLMVVPHSPQGVSLPEAAERKAQGGNGERRETEREGGSS